MRKAGPSCCGLRCVCVRVCVLITAVIALHLSQAAANTEAQHGHAAMFATNSLSLYLAFLVLTPLTHTLHFFSTLVLRNLHPTRGCVLSKKDRP